MDTLEEQFRNDQLLVVLVIPHSNTEEEHVFIVVRKNKTDFRSSLQTHGSLASILKVKMHNKNQVKFSF